MVRRPSQRQIRPGRIYEAVTTLMNHRVMPQHKVQQPVWYKVVESIPPSETLTRPLPPQHRMPKPRVRKQSRLFQPQQLKYPEDSLRRQFYQDHPWELARPRMIVEMDGRDALRCDWSTGLRQPGTPLSGECVVQRQLWLMENIPGISRDAAYDQVRREFYKLRQEEEIERRVAKEEAKIVGAYFGQTFMQVGMQLEDQQHERWKKWAEKETETIRMEQTDLLSNPMVEGENVDLDALEDTFGQNESVPARAPTPAQ